MYAKFQLITRNNNKSQSLFEYGKCVLTHKEILSEQQQQMRVISVVQPADKKLKIYLNLYKRKSQAF